MFAQFKHKIIHSYIKFILKISCLTCVDIRLSHGPDATEGILEINEDDRWRIVCNNNFNDIAAAAVCRQLRFGPPVLYHRNTSISNTQVYYLYSYNPLCSETSERLLQCFSYRRSGESCYDTFVKCSSMQI